MKRYRVHPTHAFFRDPCDLCAGRGWQPTPTGWPRPCEACGGSCREPSLYRVAKVLDEHPETIRRLEQLTLGPKASVRLLDKLTARIARLTCSCRKHLAIGIWVRDEGTFVTRHGETTAGPFRDFTAARAWADANFPLSETCALAPPKPRRARRAAPEAR